MRLIVAGMTLFLIQACSHIDEKPLPRAENVELEKFMGDWYVIANIPTFLEVDAHNAIETYDMNADGSIATTFQFNDGSFDGELKIYKPTGYVSDTDNSVWGMQFIWPFKAEFVIAYLSADYQHTIIARSARDYVWVMSRKPVIEQGTYQLLIDKVIEMGYSAAEINKVPHQAGKDNIAQETR